MQPNLPIYMLLIYSICLAISLVNLKILRDMISSTWNMPSILKESNYYLFFLATLPAIINLLISIFAIYKIFNTEGFYGILYIALCLFVISPLIIKISKLNLATTIVFRTAFSPAVITSFLLLLIFIN
jgi:hypothetical protein